jgi:hypothetical protein
MIEWDITGVCFRGIQLYPSWGLGILPPPTLYGHQIIGTKLLDTMDNLGKITQKKRL